MHVGGGWVFEGVEEVGGEVLSIKFILFRDAAEFLVESWTEFW